MSVPHPVDVCNDNIVNFEGHGQHLPIGGQYSMSVSGELDILESRGNQYFSYLKQSNLKLEMSFSCLMGGK